MMLLTLAAACFLGADLPESRLAVIRPAPDFKLLDASEKPVTLTAAEPTELVYMKLPTF